MRTPLLFGLSVFSLLWIALSPGHAGDSPKESDLRILVLGDSLTAGYGLVTEDTFPVQLQKALLSAGYPVKVINAGVSGDTSAGGVSRLEWALADRPDIVILELGGNDALRGLSPEQTASNLEQIIVRLQQVGVDILLAGMLAPRNLGSEYYSKFDNLYPELAAKHGIPLYPFFLQGVAGDPQLNLADGLHPNARGVEVIVRSILPYLQPLLDSAG
ncbi:MAG: arylesterase [Desulfuromonadales bacterium]|nr:arylesterase [Desulfuromonadales bacterium]